MGLPSARIWKTAAVGSGEFRSERSETASREPVHYSSHCLNTVVNNFKSTGFLNLGAYTARISSRRRIRYVADKYSISTVCLDLMFLMLCASLPMLDPPPVRGTTQARLPWAPRPIGHRQSLASSFRRV